MGNGWTGGQYSVFRAVLGGWLASVFVRLVPAVTRGNAASHDGFAGPLSDLADAAGWPGLVAVVLVAAVGASVALAVGFHDRTAVVLVGALLAGLAGHNPLLAESALGVVGILFLVHLLAPPAPFGSWDARRRPDPAGGWSMPAWVPATVWLTLAVTHGHAAALRAASNPWSFALPHLALAIVSLSATVAGGPARRLVWPASAALHLVGLVAPVAAGAWPAIALLHGLAFDPGWIRPSSAGQRVTLFYDGACGLCHRSVRAVLAEDVREVVRFAPLGGAAFRRTVPDPARLAMPDSLALATSEGRVLTRSSGVLEVMRRLGGLWRLAAAVIAIVPPVARDSIYDAIAAIRHRMFDRRPDDACPVVAPRLRKRFDLES